jgi:hypothetical protein
MMMIMPFSLLLALPTPAKSDHGKDEKKRRAGARRFGFHALLYLAKVKQQRIALPCKEVIIGVVKAAV